MKKRYFSFALLFYLLSNVGAPQPVSVNAAKGTRPSNIDTTYLQGQALENYYANISGKKGDVLLSTLHDIIKDHLEYDYESTTDREIYKIIDRNYDLSPLTSAQLANYNYSDNPYIIKLYADYNDDIATADTFRNPGASRVSFDKEHIWAQSMGNFGRRGGAGSDFHALWPSDVKGNQNAHSNYNYAVPTSGITNYVGDFGGTDWPQRTSGTSVGRNGTIAGGTIKVFEPTDEWKGDVARAMLYMPVRYATHVDTYHPQLKLVNGSPGTKTSSPTVYGEAGDLATLLEWNELDPPSEHEIRRNNLIYNNYQKNRNPFIDYPHWARIVYDSSYAGSGASYEVGGNELESPLVDISVDATNAKTEYERGETFTTNGLVVNATYEDGTSRQVTSFVTSPLNGTILDQIGLTNVTVTYSEGEVAKEKQYSITVSEKSSSSEPNSGNSSATSSEPGGSSSEPGEQPGEGFKLELIHYVLIGGGIALLLVVSIFIVLMPARKQKKLLKTAKKVTKALKKKK